VWNIRSKNNIRTGVLICQEEDSFFVSLAVTAGGRRGELGGKTAWKWAIGGEVGRDVVLK
jgi:hypothetical protein